MPKSIAGRVAAAATLIVLGASGALAAGAVRMPGGSAPRQAGPIDPADFTSPRANPYFPLVPGTITRFRGTEDGEHFKEKVTVTRRTRVIQGVRTTAVRDVVRRADGSLEEATTDWYAADNAGTVWYFGEATATYDENGHVESREGSWLAGRGGAVAGTIMPAQPHAGLAYRQEFFRGHAEDQAWIVGLTSVRVDAGRFRRVVRSFEWTRLEPRVVSVKLYAPGVGIVAEHDVAGGNERFELVSVRR